MVISFMNFEEKLIELIERSITACKNDRDLQLLMDLKKINDFSCLSNSQKEVILELVLIPNLKFDAGGEPIEDTMCIEKIIDELNINY